MRDPCDVVVAGVCGEPRARPVEPDLRVGVAARARVLEGEVQGRPRLLERSDVDADEAQVDREANRRDRVVRSRGKRLLHARPEERGRFRLTPGGAVRVPEGDERVGVGHRGDPVLGDRGLEVVDRGGMVATLGCERPQKELGARHGAGMSGRPRACEHLLERRLERRPDRCRGGARARRRRARTRAPRSPGCRSRSRGTGR